MSSAYPPPPKQKHNTHTHTHTHTHIHAPTHPPTPTHSISLPSGSAAVEEPQHDLRHAGQKGRRGSPAILALRLPGWVRGALVSWGLVGALGGLAVSVGCSPTPPTTHTRTHTHVFVLNNQPPHTTYVHTRIPPSPTSPNHPPQPPTPTHTRLPARAHQRHPRHPPQRRDAYVAGEDPVRPRPPPRHDPGAGLRCVRAWTDFGCFEGGRTMVRELCVCVAVAALTLAPPPPTFSKKQR